MLLGYKINGIHFSAAIPANKSCPSHKCSLSASKNTREDYIANIKNRLFRRELEVSPSSYDTAWMAMVPSSSREYSDRKQPCFPQCLDWIMENQNPNGSWGLKLMENHDNSSSMLVKDSLSCTLACLLALRKWNVGHQLVHKGLEFIGSNGWAASDKAQYTPIGFEIVFPEMINIANQLDLTLPLDTVLVDNMLRCRDLEIKRKRNLEYVAEGLGDCCNWRGLLLSRQKRNGSLFNSPATTASALIHSSHDDKCFEYLLSALKTFKNCVPTIYPLDIHTRLCIIDTLERLGIDRHFQFDIDSILNETYRLWQGKEEEIFDDITCRIMAFRLLRMRGYQVSSDELAEFADEEHFFKTVSVQFTGVTTVLELNRASKLRIYEDEVVLEKIHAWTSNFLKHQLLNETILDNRLRKEVEIALKNFGSMLDRVEDKLNIELYDVDHVQILKTAYRCPTINNKDILVFAREDFHICQLQYQKELQQLERWYTDCRLDKLKFGRNVVHISSFQAAAVIHDPQLSEARMCFAQCVVLIARLDDFFDSHASEVEARNFVELIRKWWSKQEAKIIYDVSGEAEILFTALYDTLNEWAENAHIKQGRCVKSILIGEWLEILISFMREREFSRDDKRIITLDEYLSITWISVGFKLCVNTPAHLLGIKLSEDLNAECSSTSLCKHASTVARLLNDLNTYKREKGEGKINSISLLAAESRHSEAEAISKIRQMIEQKKIQLLEMVICQTKGSLNVIPKEYKELVWMTCKTAYYLYSHGDGFSDPQESMIKDMNALIHEPLGP